MKSNFYTFCYETQETARFQTFGNRLRICGENNSQPDFRAQAKVVIKYSRFNHIKNNIAWDGK